MAATRVAEGIGLTPAAAWLLQTDRERHSTLTFERDLTGSPLGLQDIIVPQGSGNRAPSVRAKEKEVDFELDSVHEVDAVKDGFRLASLVF